MNWYISDTDKKHLQRRVDTNNRCSFSLGKAHRPSGLRARSPRGRVSPSPPHGTRRLALSTPVQNASQHFHSSVLHQESHSVGQTQHNVPPAARQGKPLQPLPSGISFSGTSSGKRQVQGSCWTRPCQDYERKARF